MDLGLGGRVALVTGASEGIGFATASEFARQGARVAVCARRPNVLDAAIATLRATWPEAEVCGVRSEERRVGKECRL